MVVAMLVLNFLEVVHYKFIHSCVCSVLKFDLIQVVFVVFKQLYRVFLLLVHEYVVVCI